MATIADGPIWSHGLAGPALEIAKTDASPLRICAGPGTGKTFTLMQRVRRLLQEGTYPERIFVVTFTRTAARDLAASLRKLDLPDADKVRTSTLHSYYFKTLQREAVLETTGRVARPLMEFEERFMLWDLKRLDRGVRENAQYLKAFVAGWAREQSEDPGWPRDQADQDFHNDLKDWLKYHQCMLIGELGNEMRAYLRNHPLCEERGFFQHILVDEYQDLNRTDQQIIDMLADSADVVIVGDEDQSIFGTLRHAQPEGIREYSTTHPGTVDIPLELCRRCPAKVVEMANSLIRHNGDRSQRTLKVFEGNADGWVKIVQYPTIEAESAGLADLVNTYLENKRAEGEEVSLEGILVLTPRRYSSTLIKEALRAYGIEAFNFYDEKALAHKEAQKAFTLLSLLVNKDDPVALRCWFGFDRSDAGSPGYQRLQQYAADQELSLPEALERLASQEPLPRWAGPLVERFAEAQDLRQRAAELKGQPLVDFVFPEDEPELEDLRRLALLWVEAFGSQVTASSLLDELKTRLLQNEPPPAGEYVRIMSPYKAKGLTAKLVVVASCMEGWVPSMPDNATAAEALRYEREQRRLFYVAITRCTDAMIISSFERMPSSHAHRSRLVPRGNGRNASIGLTSRFLNELGPHAPLPERG